MNSNRLTPILAAIAAAAVTALVLVLALGGDDDDDDDRPVATASQPAASPAATTGSTAPDPDDQDDQAEATPAPSGGQASTASGLRALRTAEREAGATAYDIDLEDGQQAWTVAFPDGTELVVSADGREVQQRLTDDVDPEDQQYAADARVSLADAVRAAESEVDGTLDSADIDRDDDIANAPLLWNLSFTTTTGETEIAVDATSGEVVSRNLDD